jgi:hypothetical protein
MARAAFQNVTKMAGHIDITGKQVGIQAKTINVVATPTPLPGFIYSTYLHYNSTN